MSLELSNSPGKPEIKTFFDNDIRIATADSEIHITMNDFMAAAYYVITNTPLEPNDPRLTFINVIKQLKLMPSKRSFQLRDKECWSLSYPGDYIDFKWKEGDLL